MNDKREPTLSAVTVGGVVFPTVENGQYTFITSYTVPDPNDCVGRLLTSSHCVATITGWFTQEKFGYLVMRTKRS